MTDCSPTLGGRDDMTLLLLSTSSISSLMGVRRSGNGSTRPLDASWACRIRRFSSGLMDETSSRDSFISVTSDSGIEGGGLGPRLRNESFMVSEIWENQMENGDGVESAIVMNAEASNIHWLKTDPQAWNLVQIMSRRNIFFQWYTTSKVFGKISQDIVEPLFQRSSERSNIMPHSKTDNVQDHHQYQYKVSWKQDDVDNKMLQKDLLHTLTPSKCFFNKKKLHYSLMFPTKLVA